MLTAATAAWNDKLPGGQANGLLEAKVDMMRDNLNAARADASAKAALEQDVSALRDQLAAQSARLHSADRESVPERPISGEGARQGTKSAAELEKEVESLQQTNKLLTDQIRSLQVGPQSQTSALTGASKAGGEAAHSVYRTCSLFLVVSGNGPCLCVQAKADAARQEAETVTAENSQLGAHLQLLESELDSARHLQTTDSNEGSPRQSQLLPETMPHGLTPQQLDLPGVSANIPAVVSATLVLAMRPTVPHRLKKFDEFWEDGHVGMLICLLLSCRTMPLLPSP